MELGIEEGALLDDRYQVGRKIGEGGMGAVFEGENRLLRRPVAIKALRPHLALDAEALARFQREAELTSSLNHPHIVAVLDMNFRTPPYIVMELLEGESLRARLVRDGTVAPSRCIAIAAQLLSALAESHERGILHRDVKPANVFLATNAAVGVSVKLLDFGIAKLTEIRPGQKRITQPSHIVGSGAYMSPEQILAQPLGPETDIFSVGVLLYEALSGDKPFCGDDVTGTMARIVAGDPPPSIEGVHPPLMKIVLRALARTPSARFASAREMGKALEPLLPRFSSMNLQSPVVREDRTEPLAPSNVKTDRTRPPGGSPLAKATMPMIRPTVDPPAPMAEPLAVTQPIATLAPRVESRPPPPPPGVAAAVGSVEEVAASRTGRVPSVVLVGGLLLLGVGLVLYGALQRPATYAPQARAGKMEWRSVRIAPAATSTSTMPGAPSGAVFGRSSALAAGPAAPPPRSSSTSMSSGASSGDPTPKASSAYTRFE